MLMLDLCSGLGGASSAMRLRGWKVITLDNNPQFKPDICTDINTWVYDGRQPDLIWASPPCTEFAREFMPWSRKGDQPDLTIYNACRRIILEVKPRYWVIENVKGAIRYFGKPVKVYGAFCLWGYFPDLGRVNLRYKKKESYSSKKKAERAKIPLELSEKLAVSIERSMTLF